MQPSASNSKPNLQSCQFCRKRKIKCDKLEGGCSQCLRSQIECVYPASQRKGRPRKAGTSRPPPPPTPREAQLLKKIWKLERIIDDLTGKGGLVPPPGDIGGLHTDTDETPREQLGRLVIGRPYVDDTFWSNQLKNVLEDSDEESNYDDEDSTPFSAAPTSSSGAYHANFLFGVDQAPADLSSLHPPSAQIQMYWKLYQENCEVLLRVFHTPTISKLIDQAEAHVTRLSKTNEVVMFSIYFATITSMTPEEVSDTFGAEKATLIPQYEHAVRSGLVNAGFLNSQDLAVLQAFVLYLICIRHTDGAAVWTMTGLALRIAHGMGVDRDGEHFKLPPLEVELRRRVWHQISLLDLRSSEARGAFATLLTYDTKLPSNINDSDISPETREYPKPRVGLTDMSGALLRLEVCQTTRRLFKTPSMVAKERLIEEFGNNMETNYMKYCDQGGPLHRWCAKVGRLVKERMMLMLFRREENLPPSIRERLFFTSVHLIDLSNQLRRDDYARRWHWVVRTYMQWHAMAVVLFELTEQPITPETERAWRIIEQTGPDWELPEDSAGKILSQSVKRLLIKAQAHRTSLIGAANIPTSLALDPRLEDEGKPPQQSSQGQNQTQPISFVQQQLPSSFNISTTGTSLMEDSYPPQVSHSHTQFVPLSGPLGDHVQEQQNHHQQFYLPHAMPIEDMGHYNWNFDSAGVQGLHDHTTDGLVLHGQPWTGWDSFKDNSIHGGTV